MKKKVEIEIEHCDKCPYCNKVPVFFQMTGLNTYYCSKQDNKLIHKLVNEYMSIEIPEWCSL